MQLIERLMIMSERNFMAATLPRRGKVVAETAPTPSLRNGGALFVVVAVEKKG
jgi:hypothetical protein